MGQNQRRTKIVATWGPAVASEERLRGLMAAGVDVFRLNFSHASHTEIQRAVPLVRELAAEMGHEVSLMQDIQGPRLRTGLLPRGEPVRLVAGSTISVTSHDELGSPERLCIPYPHLTDDVQPGQRILIADGTISLRVTALRDGELEATVVNGGLLGEHKGVNLPDSSVSADPLTPKDLDDLRFGVEIGVDYVAMSFVRRGSDVIACKRFISELGRDTPLIAKIEHPEAIENLEEILRESDGVMVARGDLGVEVSPERVPLLQKHIIMRANQMGLPVITATQMLESMVQRPIPTRAEASDVANAVLDGTDALMLSAETAVGDYPVEAVETMGRIALEAEAAESNRHLFNGKEPAHVLANAARELASELDARALLVFTRSGKSAETLSQQRPDLPIYALTPDEHVRRRLALWYGVSPLHAEISEDIESMIDLGLAKLRELGAVVPHDRVVFFGSMPVRIGAPPNLINVFTVPEG
ncbi:MAG: pyruvate kinase [Dehalococcoidia bacterium]